MGVREIGARDEPAVPARGRTQRGKDLAGVLARASGEVDALTAALALKAGNRAVGRVLARRHRRYQDTPLGSHTPTMAPADVDRQLERLRTTGRGRGRAAVRLGAITGVDTAAAAEQARVMYLIWQYVEFAKVENAELDAVIELPVPLNVDNADPLGTLPPAPKVLWTLTFTTANRVTDVAAERIGPPDDTLSIAKVRGYPGRAKGHAAISTWVRQRFPALATVAVPTVQPQRIKNNAPTPAAIAAANEQATRRYVAALDVARRTQARAPAWFATNYGIDVLTAAAASTRMDTAHSWATGRRADMRDWEPARLQVLESALETIDTSFLKALRKVKLVRQRVRLVPAGRGSFREQPSIYGETVRHGNEVTIVIYDSHGDLDDLRFVGGRGGLARRAGVMQLLHEIGHAVSYRTAGLETAFGRRFAGTASPTAYGRSSVVEKFPEAFALYHSDPAHLRGEWQEIYDWFDLASQTGTAPPPPPKPRARGGRGGR